MTPDFRMHFAGMPESFDVEWYRKLARGFYENFSEVRHEIQQIVAERDRVAVWTVIHGRHTGLFQGIAPTGRKIAVTQTVLVRIERNRIAEEWVLGDTASLLRQLGPL